MAKDKTLLDEPVADRKITPEDEARIKELLAAVHKAEDNNDAAKESAKSAKACLELAQSRFNQFMDDLMNPQQTLPFKEPEPWRDVTTEGLGLSKAICEKLANHNPAIKTLGHIADWTSDESHKLTDVKGIGEGMAGVIEEACEQYWVNNPQPSDDSGDDDDGAVEGEPEEAANES